jgi:hypothetical protein
MNVKNDYPSFQWTKAHTNGLEEEAKGRKEGRMSIDAGQTF